MAPDPARVRPRRFLVPAIAAVGVTALAASGISALWELPVRDLVLRVPPPRPARHVAVITVDEAALAAVGPWPWTRERLAELVVRARQAGAALVALDVLLPDPRPGDEALGRALASGPAVLVAAPTEDGRRWILPAPALREAATVAHASLPLDHDGVLRRVVAVQQADGLALPALAAAVAAASGWGPLPVGRALAPAFRVPPDGVPRVGAAELLAGSVTPGAWRGRAVFIGATAAGLGDRAVTPRDAGERPSPGVEVQAAIAEALRSGDLVRTVPPWLAGLVAALLVSLARTTRRLGGAGRAALAAACVLGPPLLGATALATARVASPFVTLGAVAFVAVFAVEADAVRLASRRSTAAARALEPADGPRAPEPSALEDRLARLEELARAAARRRDDDAEARRLLAHELKTPLASVRGFAQLLAEFDLAPDERRRVARMASAEADRLRAMVDGLLALERLALRDFASTTSELDLGELVASRCEGFRAGGHRVEVEAAAGAIVRGDPTLLGEVIDNLVSNAVRYGPADRAVGVRLGRSGADAVLEVRDDGPGIPDDERRTIFERFRRGAAAAGTAGLGLGLAVVAEVVTWHRGRVELDSRPGAGSAFRVILPAVPAPAAGG